MYTYEKNERCKTIRTRVEQKDCTPARRLVQTGVARRDEQYNIVSSCVCNIKHRFSISEFNC